MTLCSLYITLYGVPIGLESQEAAGLGIMNLGKVENSVGGDRKVTCIV